MNVSRSDISNLMVHKHLFSIKINSKHENAHMLEPPSLQTCLHLEKLQDRIGYRPCSCLLNNL